MCMELGSAPTCGVMPLGTVGWPGIAPGCLHMMHCGTVTSQHRSTHSCYALPKQQPLLLAPSCPNPHPSLGAKGGGGEGEIAWAASPALTFHGRCSILLHGISLESSSTKELYSGQESTQTTVPKPAATWKPESSSRIGLETVPCAALAEEQPDGMGDAARCPCSQIAQVLTASLLPSTTSPVALPQLSPEGTGAQGRDSRLHVDTGAAGPSGAT
ncbi:uncharacterized protein LOC104913567 [Meleagris gallopavo]|uniref:uncharacterized protein LOC104913567 n=1 Tax=Meleagris gallopavo TaxID=9103 RepID=UPI00093D05FC|nr:uncharacterized protein LOC104913567 [Meleagris gallopavo]